MNLIIAAKISKSGFIIFLPLFSYVFHNHHKDDYEAKSRGIYVSRSLAKDKGKNY